MAMPSERSLRGACAFVLGCCRQPQSEFPGVQSPAKREGFVEGERECPRMFARPESVRPRGLEEEDEVAKLCHEVIGGRFEGACLGLDEGNSASVGSADAIPSGVTMRRTI